MSPTAAERRAAVLSGLRQAQSRLLPLEVEQRRLEELVGALSRSLEQARQRVNERAVTAAELSAHLDEALRLGQAQRRLLQVIDARRSARLEVALRTARWMRR
jgi:hypothetical protein